MTTRLPDFKNAHILVIGDIMLDRYWSGATSRISPEAPVPVVKVNDIEDRLGGAANVAKNIAALGCKVSLCGIIGNDATGTTVKSLLEQAQINDFLIEDNNTPTITKLRVLSRHQQLLRMDFEETLHNCVSEKLLETVKSALSDVDVVVISDYAKGTITDATPLIDTCKNLKIPTFIDPKGNDFGRYTGASLITPNLSELEGIVGSCNTLKETYAKAETLRKELQLENMLVTLSEKGMALLREDHSPFHTPTSAKDVFDVTGAGDTVIATLAATFAAGSSLQEAVLIANTAAGIVVGKLGTSTVSPEELEETISIQEQIRSQGIATLETLKQEIDACRQRGERIVFTNGCFDILHAGHVRYLKQAASLGDRLVVGINSDESIKKLKGESRPILNLEERMEVLAALNSVDWVIPFEEDTPKNLIDAIIPDVLTKGGDYQAETIVGYDTVTKNGGTVDVLTFVDGCSTSSIIEKIKSSD